MTNWDIAVKVLKKHTDGSSEGAVFWDVVEDFLRSKDITIQNEESFWAYGDEWELSTESKLRSRLKQLFASEEFQKFKTKWLKELNEKFKSNDLDKMLLPSNQ